MENTNNKTITTELKEEQLKFYRNMNEILPGIKEIISVIKYIVLDLESKYDDLDIDEFNNLMKSMNKLSNSPELTSDFFKGLIDVDK